MPRRTFLRYVKADVQHEQAHTYLVRYRAETLFQHWQTLPTVTSEDLFASGQPLELEIGCGSAEYLCSLAAQAPSTNFVGLDISGKALSRAVANASSLALRNIKFINADLQFLYPLLRPESLQAVYLHFPDPHCKPGHRKRRLFNTEFLDRISTALQTSGRLSVMTDVDSFFMDMLTLIEQDPRFEKVHPQRYLLGFEPEVKSLFQRIWEQYGESVYRFEVRKRELEDKA